MLKIIHTDLESNSNFIGTMGMAYHHFSMLMCFVHHRFGFFQGHLILVDEFDDINSRIDQFLYFCSGICSSIDSPAEGFCAWIRRFLDKWSRHIDRGTWDFSFLDAFFDIDAGLEWGS